MSNEIWFKHKPGLIIVGRPVHWKGWAMGLLFGAALTAVILAMTEIARATPANERLTVWIIGYALAAMLALAFAIAAWPHREPRPK